MNDSEVSSTRRHRSPSYPAIDLGTAVVRAEQLAAIAGRHTSALPPVAQAWGYSPKSSNGPVTVAALRQFGLAEMTSGKVGLTPFGHEVIVYGRDRASTEWVERVKRAALMPTVFAELWQKYRGELPSDFAILPDLILDMGFRESSAKDLLRQFRKTLEFADLSAADASDMVSGDDVNPPHDALVVPGSLTSDTAARPVYLRPSIGGSGPSGPSGPSGAAGPGAYGPSGPSATSTRTIQLPYAHNRWALLQADFPMSPGEWDQMLAVLDAMKPALIAEPADEPRTD